ncbi:MAG: hypothetical protein MRY64_04285 [Hyphomonadaceae bacterium]|nr:hypothetical protein [Hyphomonadaceae bacterium]
MSVTAERDTPSRSLRDALALFAQPKTAMMLVLGFTAGLPFLLYFSALSVWLERSEVDTAIIGFFSWFGLSYSFKFLWAPLVDRFNPPGLTGIFGRRRAWIFVAQIGLAMAMIGVGFSDPTQNLSVTALFAFLIAFCSATQDIGIDAWRIEAADDDDEQASLAAAYQYGYKVGMVISGGVALVIAGIASFQVAYWAMAGTMALAALVFAVWDRKSGMQAAAAAGVMLLSIGLASAFGAFASISGGAGWLHGGLKLAEYALYCVAGGAALGFAWFIFKALMDQPEGTSFSASGLVLGIGFAAACFAGVALLAIGFGLGLPRLASLLGFAPDRGDIAKIAVYVAGTPLILCTIAIPLIRRFSKDSPHLQNPAYGAFVDFFWRHGWAALLILIFVSTYRLSDIVMGIMAKPAYSAMGYTPADIGIVSGTYGPWIVFVGVALAGLSALKLGLRVSLIIGAIVSVLGNVIFAWLVSQSADSLFPLFVAVTADNIAGGYAGTIFIAFMSSFVNRSFAGTQYAIFSSVWSLGPKLIAGTSGVMVASFSAGDEATLGGYSTFFLVAAGFGLPAIFLSFLTAMMKPDREVPPAAVARPGPAE